MFKITTANDIDMIRGKFSSNVISECERLAKILMTIIIVFLCMVGVLSLLKMRMT